MTKWITRNDDHSNNPIEDGIYAVIVAGDSDHIAGQVVYDFDDYQTFADFKFDDHGGVFYGMNGEHDDWIIAYYGPIVIPNYKAPK